MSVPGCEHAEDEGDVERGGDGGDKDGVVLVGWRKLYKNRSSRKINSQRLLSRPLLLLRISFPGRHIFIQFIPGEWSLRPPKYAGPPGEKRLTLKNRRKPSILDSYFLDQRLGMIRIRSNEF